MKIYKYGLSHLKSCSNLSGLATLLEVQPRFFSKQIYHTESSEKYHEFIIQKKDGTDRKITAPNKNLKFIQSRLSRLLYQCYLDIHGMPKNLKTTLSHGFQRGRNLSIYTNAIKHSNRKFVLNVDIENFFDSFNFGRVRGYFIKNNRLDLNSTVATVIAQTVCFKDSLPQGAPSSPIVTEFITGSLDYRLQTLAKKKRCTYSRYADDITFSTNLAIFPDGIAQNNLGPGGWAAGVELNNAIKKAGFSLNLQKTRMQIHRQRQSVTSLTVNKTPNISSYYYKGTRFMAHSMMSTGKAAPPKESIKTDKEITAGHILGRLSHIYDIKGRNLDHKALRYYNKKNPPPQYLRIIGDFYHYNRIHINKKPIIVCEGKTDYVYLKEAIRWNSTDKQVSNLLVDVGKLSSKPSNGDHWHIDFLKHTKTAANFLNLSGGGGDLRNFAETHLDRISKFHTVDAQPPVIIIVDNDAQSAAMWSFISEKTGSSTKIDGSKELYNVGQNLFVVPIPSGGEKDFFIEKLFPPEWLKEKIGNKSLKLKQKKNEKLSETEYGKSEFSEKVIRANRGKVDCSNFLPLLHTVCKIIET